MATRYWVGGGSSANWNAVSPTNWAATSGGTNNQSVPGSADDVLFDANSGSGTSNISASNTIHTLDCTGFIGTLTQAGSTSVSLGGALFKLSAAMTYTPASQTTSGFTFINTGPAGTMLITTAGKTMAQMSFNGSGGTYQLQDDLTLSSTASITFQQGTLDANNKNVSCGLFSSFVTTGRTLLMGSGTWTLTALSGNVWRIRSGMTVSGSATIILANGGTGLRSFSGGGSSVAYNNIIIGSSVLPGGSVALDGSTFNNVTIARPNTVTGSANLTLTASSITFSGAGALMLSSNNIGANTTLSVASGNVSLRGATLKNLTGAGGAAFRASDAIDLGGNSGITIVPPGASPSYQLGI